MDGKQKKRRWWAALAILSALPLAGALHQSWEVRAEALRFPAPGRLVTVGQRRLHLVCVGEGAPTVIFEAGGFTSALSFEAARREVSVHTRVCSYDRAGMVWSDPGPAAITP
ncbi:MAG TPA: hypothetical protein VL371_06435, partial [Gemmataceae bacterium]|nr:hypothetical protein [Gemmataceae bacterium]